MNQFILHTMTTVHVPEFDESYVEKMLFDVLKELSFRKKTVEKHIPIFGRR